MVQFATKIINREILPAEALSFVRSRFNQFQTPFSINKIYFPNPDHNLWIIVRKIFIEGEYDLPNTLIDKDDIVVDIGAHKGGFCGYAATKTSGTIFAFEPNLENYQTLEAMVKANNLHNIQINRSAVTNSHGTVKLYFSTSNTRHNIFGKDVLSDELLAEFELVDLVTLADIFNSLPRVDVLKVDCEGAEFGIFEHTSIHHLRLVRKIIIEYHDYFGSEKVSKLTAKLAGSGFILMHKKVGENLPLGLLFGYRN